MVSFSNYIENVYEWINAGCCQETIKMTNEFNYKLMVTSKWINILLIDF
jgi:hypothetical protein